jgi:hypothetical protein
MSREETFGRMAVPRGERCTNPGFDDRFTTPCCYADVTDEDATACPECGAPIVCEVERQPVAVCRIADEDKDEAWS